jgi:hypothetical protein
MHGRFAQTVIEAESARNEVEQAASQDFGDVRDAFFHRDTGGTQQVFDVGGDADAGVFDELEGFVEDALDQRLVEEFEFGA